MINEPISLSGEYHPVEHYYGDIVRQLFIAGVAVMLIGAPFYANSLYIELPFEVLGGIGVVALAAFTNPMGKTIMMANAIAAGVILLIYQTWALLGYSASGWLVFFLRELIALIFMAAFYFSLKTLRAMVMHMVGVHTNPRHFGEAGGEVSHGTTEEENIVHFKREEDIFDDTGTEHKEERRS